MTQLNRNKTTEEQTKPLEDYIKKDLPYLKITEIKLERFQKLGDGL